LGNIREPSLSQLPEHPAQKAFGPAKFANLPAYCLKCKVREMCNSTCPKDRFTGTHNGETRLNYLQEGYKLFFNYFKPFVEQIAEVWRRALATANDYSSFFLKNSIVLFHARSAASLLYRSGFVSLLKACCAPSYI